MATDHPTCRAKAQSLPAPKFWRRRGLQRPLSLFKGRPGRTREDARTSANQAATGDVEREGGVVMEKQRFRQTLSRYDRQHQNHRILSMLGGSTGPEARTLPCISARILLVPFHALSTSAVRLNLCFRNHLQMIPRRPERCAKPTVATANMPTETTPLSISHRSQLPALRVNLIHRNPLERRHVDPPFAQYRLHPFRRPPDA